MTEATNTPAKEEDDALVRRIIAAHATIDVATRNKKAAEAELLARRKDEITALLKAKDEPFGKVDIIAGNHKLEITTPKKVEWDNDKLEGIANLMRLDGTDPKLHMKIEHSISETVYKGWPDDMREYFAPARTVKAGSVSVKIVPEKE